MDRFLLRLLMWCLIDSSYHYSFGYVINCLEIEDCVISCEGTQSCMNSIMNCPKIGDCNIECYGQRSCQDVTINATHSSGNINIKCKSSTDDCRRMTIYGSRLDTNIGNLNIYCDGEYGSCINSKIHCPLTGNCNIECNGHSSCKSSNIYGPLNGDLIISCNNYQSCYNGIFNGEYSDEMDIKGCIATESCLDVELHCPPNTNNSPNCFLEGNNNLGGNIIGGHGIEIYAVNGWKDIFIDYIGGITQYINDGYNNQKVIGHMHCGFGYDIPCDIPINSWTCKNIDDYCNNNIDIIDEEIYYYKHDMSNNQNNINHYIPTQKPTIIPTFDHILTTSPPCHNHESIENELETTQNIFQHNAKLINSLHTQFERGPMGMIIIGSSCILLAICCTIIGAIRKSNTSKYQIANIINQSKHIMSDNEISSDVHSVINLPMRVKLKPDAYNVIRHT